MPNADGWGVIQDWGNRQAVKSVSMFRRFLRVQLRTAGQKPYMEVGPAPKDNRGKWKSCACWLAGFSLISGAGGDILIEMYVALINRTKVAWRMVKSHGPRLPAGQVVQNKFLGKGKLYDMLTAIRSRESPETRYQIAYYETLLARQSQ